MKDQSFPHPNPARDALLFGSEPEPTVEEIVAAQVVAQAEKIDPGTVIWSAERRGADWIVQTPKGPFTLRQLEQQARAAA